MPTATRQNLIDAAAKRFYRDGFRNVGIDQILADVGISKTAFYKHFQCKEDLMLAALDAFDKKLHQKISETLRQYEGESGVVQLMALFDVVEIIVAADDFQGCVFVNASIEFPLLHEPAHAAAARSKQAFEDVIAHIATTAGVKDPRTLAKELCLVMEGAYVTRHVTGDRAAMQIARRIGQRIIAGHLPPAV